MFVNVVVNRPILSEFTYSCDESLSPQVGKRCVIDFHGKKMTGFIVKTFESLPENFSRKVKDVSRLCDDAPVFNSEIADLARKIARFYVCSVGEALSAMLPGAKRESGEFSSFFADGEGFFSGNSLSEGQKAAVEGISARLGEASVNYVYGVTGSGKTEVFLSLAEKVVSQGKSAIYLVPEISLARQAAESAAKRFGPCVSVLHSALSPSKRLREWRKIMAGEAKIVVGARSAVFAPAKKLGLIIIDEEHDGSYKSGSTPRYHARQVAMMRAAALEIPVVMGSATPSMEAFRMMKEGKIFSWRLTERLAGGASPAVELVDMKGESGCISKRLYEEILGAREKRLQTVLFLNRRGFTHYFSCGTCGAEIKCKNCSVSLTFHKAENRLRCHYCGYSAPPPSKCPECGSLDIGYYGAGTEFVEEELRAKLPDVRILRVDADTAQDKDLLEKTLALFREGGADVLLGTQMVAKGLNFPRVNLVGIINADTSLQMPDFRAAERAFALVVQAAGRSGRFLEGGKVVVQSRNPDRPAIAMSAKGRIDEFYEYELGQRKALFFPPFSRVARIVFRSAEKDLAALAATECLHILERRKIEWEAAFGSQTVEILGPSECPLAQVAQNWRFQLLLRCEKIAPLQELCQFFYSRFSSSKKVYAEIDIDPASLM